MLVVVCVTSCCDVGGGVCVTSCCDVGGVCV